MMITETTENERVRAWVLVKTEVPEEAVDDLYRELGYEGGDDWVVVRADVVARDPDVEGPYSPIEADANVVIPVDVRDRGELEHVIQLIVERLGDQIAVLNVGSSNPSPPHIANGYVTHGELAAQHEQRVDVGEYIKAGRQGHSPGFNAWG